MEYLTIAEARERDGLRLVLTAGVPGPWGEAAKAILEYKKLDYLAVRQDGGGENAELLEWTGQNSAPVAVYNDERPRAQSLEILYLAERLSPDRPLIPSDFDQRAQMFGLIHSIIGEQGIGWQRRLMLLHPLAQMPGMAEAMGQLIRKYGYDAEAAELSVARCAQLLNGLSAQLKRQRESGSDYFIGDSLTAVDLYWAAFAGMLRPLPPEQNPCDEQLRASYASIPDELAPAVDEILFEHRDNIYQRHLKLPLDF